MPPTSDIPSAAVDPVVLALVDQSAATALEHAAALHARLLGADGDGHQGLEHCSAAMHQLVGDIVSLRNAAELLKATIDRIEPPTD